MRKNIKKKHNSLNQCSLNNIFWESNWIFAKNSHFPIPISLLPNAVDLWYFKRRIFTRTNNLRLKYQTFTRSYCKDIGIRKFEFLAKTNSIDNTFWEISTLSTELYLNPLITKFTYFQSLDIEWSFNPNLESSYFCQI